MNLAKNEIHRFISNCIYFSIFEQKSGDLVKVYIVAMGLTQNQSSQRPLFISSVRGYH